MKFEWNDEKSKLNVQNHQVSSEEAKEVFLDPMHISKLDHRFDYFEERWITLGTTTKDKILVVANIFFDENGEEIIHIISARKANQKEKIFYEQHKEREKMTDTYAQSINLKLLVEKMVRIVKADTGSSHVYADLLLSMLPNPNCKVKCHIGVAKLIEMILIQC